MRSRSVRRRVRWWWLAAGVAVAGGAAWAASGWIAGTAGVIVVRVAGVVAQWLAGLSEGRAAARAAADRDQPDDRPPWMVAPAMEPAVDRPDVLDPLANLLTVMDDTRPVAVTTAVYGAGGFGKTTSVASVCRRD